LFSKIADVSNFSVATPPSVSVPTQQQQQQQHEGVATTDAVRFGEN
jgi:hypothetical protein